MVDDVGVLGIAMNVLIVESDPDLGRLWQRHMERQGLTVRLEADQQQAISALQTAFFAVIVLDLVLTAIIHEAAAFCLGSWFSGPGGSRAHPMSASG